MVSIAEVTKFLRRFADPRLAEDWDNVGLLVGDSRREIDNVTTCLTLTEAVAEEAVKRGSGLVVSHHPLMFRPIQRITTDTAEGRTLLTLMERSIAVYSPHTSYDSAAQGINQQLAELFELSDVAVLRPMTDKSQSVLVCYVPRGVAKTVRDALWAAGAGRFGHYDECSFQSEGAATFRGDEFSHPSVGTPGERQSTDDIRLELICANRALPRVLDALLTAHPYEEPAYNIYPLEQQDTRIGAGRFGNLPDAMSLSEFNAVVKDHLSVSRLQYVGDPTKRIARVAIACGAAAEFLRDAAARDCDVLLTGEARYHQCLEAESRGVALVLPGHHATERPAMERLATILNEEFPSLVVSASECETDPVRWD